MNFSGFPTRENSEKCQKKNLKKCGKKRGVCEYFAPFFRFSWQNFRFCEYFYVIFYTNNFLLF